MTGRETTRFPAGEQGGLSARLPWARFFQKEMMMAIHMEGPHGWITIAQAADELGTTPLNVLMHIKRGLLLGEEIDGAWRVESLSLAALCRQRTEGVLPAVCKSHCSKAGGCGSCG
jgi:hypothetical protein